jgi:hypothetical protein
MVFIFFLLDRSVGRLPHGGDIRAGCAHRMHQLAGPFAAFRLCLKMNIDRIS